MGIDDDPGLVCAVSAGHGKVILKPVKHVLFEFWVFNDEIEVEGGKVHVTDIVTVVVILVLVKIGHFESHDKIFT